MTGIKSVESRNLLQLWTGAGGIDEIFVTGTDGSGCSFVAKSIGSYKMLEDDELALVDHMSYYNEATFYEHDLADRMYNAGLQCPRPLLVDRRTDGEVTICMTKLRGRSFRRTEKDIKAALTWLARLHALFWGERADKVVEMGLLQQGCFWHLDTRQIELARMPARDRLRLAASGIDARLKADEMQTMCHGDPKGANIMWDDRDGISFYDFQWFGKAPPSKDLAYFFATAAGVSSDTEETYLRHYHLELGKLLEAQGEDSRPTFAHLWDSYRLAHCDLGRWMVGGFKFGNTNLIFGHVTSLLHTLDGGKALGSEEEYRSKIFEKFPPGGSRSEQPARTVEL